MTEEIVEKEQSEALRKVLAECIEFVAFEQAFPESTNDFLEKLL